MQILEQISYIYMDNVFFSNNILFMATTLSGVLTTIKIPEAGKQKSSLEVSVFCNIA